MNISLIYSDSEKSKRKQSTMARNSKRSTIPSHAPIADSDSPVESKYNHPRFKKQRIKFERSISSASAKLGNEFERHQIYCILLLSNTITFKCCLLKTQCYLNDSLTFQLSSK